MRLLRVAVPVHHEGNVVHVGRLARIGPVHNRADVIEDVGPDLVEAPAEGAGMPPAEDRCVSVVVEHDPLGSPGHEHRLG